MKTLSRISHIKMVERCLKENPVVAVLGPRQVGKTTLARQLVSRRKGKSHFFDLEQPQDLARLDEPMLGHYHGQVLNASEIGRSFGVSHTTVRSYLDLLTNTFMVRQLRPWLQNVGKRIVKSPKVYITDSGILHQLLALPRPTDVEGHPKLGASWEGFMLGEVIRRLRAWDEECFFWATQAGAELDLLVMHGNHRLGFEFKRTDSPRVTASMRSAVETLDLSSLTVVHAGGESFPLGRKVHAIAATRLLEELKPLRR